MMTCIEDGAPDISWYSEHFTEPGVMVRTMCLDHGHGEVKSAVLAARARNDPEGFRAQVNTGQGTRWYWFEAAPDED